MRWLILPLLALTAASVPAQQDYPLACLYAPRGGELDRFEACAAQANDGTIRLAPAHRAKLDFDRNGLASVHVGKHFHYVARNGRSAPVMTMDNGADPFVGGRARSLSSPANAGPPGFSGVSLRHPGPRLSPGKQQGMGGNAT
jgi:hypothetical protein